MTATKGTVFFGLAPEVRFSVGLIRLLDYVANNMDLKPDVPLTIC